jgi:hypothetical protein
VSSKELHIASLPAGNDVFPEGPNIFFQLFAFFPHVLEVIPRYLVPSKVIKCVKSREK